MKQILFILLSISVFVTKAQNLIPNPSFERNTTSICPAPYYIDMYTDVIPWFQYNSADCFNNCDTSNFYGMPKNRFGYQYSHSGNGYVGLLAYLTFTDGGENIEVQLINPLIAGQTYFVDFFVSLADSSRYAIQNIGALFTDTIYDPYPAPTYTFQAANPQIESTTILIDKINWTHISGSFVASGGEKYMTIGNFRKRSNTITQYMSNGGGSSYSTAYYFIDDIYVGGTPLILNELLNEATYSIFPNPFSIETTIVSSVRLLNAKAILYNTFGQEVKYLNNLSGKSIHVNRDGLTSGLYSLIIINEGKFVSSKKIIITD